MISYVDGHCDTIVRIFEEKQELYENDGQVDLLRLQAYDAPVQMFALWLDAKYYPVAMKQMMRYIDFFYRQMEKNKAHISHVRTFSDILQNKKEHKASAVLTMEGGEALEGSLSALRMYHRLGVRILSLTWNHRNQLADGVGERETGGGLTTLGKQMVKEMNRIGMLLDVSHLSEPGFWDVCRTSEKPFIATHSNARAVCDVPRNLSDAQLRELAQRGGVTGLNFYPPFLSEKPQAHIEDVLRHVSHMLTVAGEDAIVLGSDFDGIPTNTIGLPHVGAIQTLYELLAKEFGTEIADKIVEKNFLRVLEQALA